MTNKPDDTCTIVVTADERRAILEHLYHRNQIRREGTLPALDIRKFYHLKVQQLQDQKYQKTLEPYLRAASQQIIGHPGVAGRIQQFVQTHRLAESALHQDTGMVNPSPCPPDMRKMMMRYMNGKLEMPGSNNETRAGRSGTTVMPICNQFRNMPNPLPDRDDAPKLRK